MKEIRLFIICLLLISVVSGEDLTCEAGEGIGIFTSGYASQCSGLGWQKQYTKRDANET